MGNTNKPAAKAIFRRCRAGVYRFEFASRSKERKEKTAPKSAYMTKVVPKNTGGGFSVSVLRTPHSRSGRTPALPYPACG
jgi:hypothetical protein